MWASLLWGAWPIGVGLCAIHRSAWKGNSPKFADTAFSEVGVTKGRLRVHLSDEDRRPARGDIRDVVGCCLSLLSGHAALQLLHVPEVALEDAVVGRLATVWRSDDPGRLVPLKVGHLIDQRNVGIGVVILESIRVVGVSIEDR